MSDEVGITDSHGESRRYVLFVAALLLVGLHLMAGPLVRLSQWRVADTNHALIEARAWRSGRLDLPVTRPDPLHNRKMDTAYVDGKVYNVFPPLFTFFCYIALALQQAQQGLANLPDAALQNVFPPWYIAGVGLSLPLLGYWAFRGVTGRSEWAAVLTAYWILGTPLLPILVNCANGDILTVNHALSNTGLILIAGDLLGKRRIWPAAIGLVIGVWTRQLTVFYLAALIWVVWTLSARRKRDLAIVGSAALVGLGTLGALSWAKFGNPLDSGYAHIYEGRTDLYAERARQYGRLFDVRFMPENLKNMNLALPELRVSRMRPILADGPPTGTAIWLTSPLLVFGILDARRWWRDPARRALMLSSLAVIAGFLCYHATGSVQVGQFRFALDFAPIWLMVIAPFAVAGWRRWVTLGCLAYSALYFNVLCSVE